MLSPIRKYLDYDCFLWELGMKTNDIFFRGIRGFYFSILLYAQLYLMTRNTKICNNKVHDHVIKRTSHT